jgi:hypothetical protein
MSHRVTRRFLTVVLGFVFVLSASLSTAQAAWMAAEMPKAMAMGMDMAGHQDCGDCTGGMEKDGLKHAACVQACIGALAAVLPAEAIVMTMDAVAHAAPWLAPEFGRTSPPSLSPPRA